MNSSIDLNLLLLARLGTNLTSDLPDLYAVTPPRHTARGREADSLIIYLSIAGNSPLSAEAHRQLLEQLAHKFYKTTGSLTAAMRTIIESLNLYLLDRNLRSTSVGRQGVGHLLLVALRADTLYIAQCGPVHAFVVTPSGTQHLYDLQSSGRGLGFSRTAPIRFLQTRLTVGDYLVLATQASPNWSEATVINPVNQGVEAIRSTLLASASQDFNAVIVQAQAGSGKLRLLRRKADAPEMVQPVAAEPTASIATTETPTTPIKAIESLVDDGALGIPTHEIPPVTTAAEPLEDKTTPVEEIPTAVLEAPGELSEDKGLGIPSEIPQSHAPQDEIVSPAEISESASPAVIPPSTPFVVPAQQETESSIASLPTVEPAARPEPTTEAVVPGLRTRREQPAAPLAPWLNSLAKVRSTSGAVGVTILRALRSALGTIGAALLRLLKNLLPDPDVLHVSPSMMVFIAVAIPLILAVVGGMVFLQRGRAQQYQIYYQQAAQQASGLASITDPVEQRLALKAIISKLDKAEYYNLTSQSQQLRTQVTGQLDALDAVKRLDYKPAIVDGLDPQIIVTRIVATTSDLYLLNGKQGNVLRGIMTSRGYVIDPNFQCGPTYGPLNVGPLVDIAELPIGAFENASLLGMDANGNLLYCVVDSQPYSAAMAPPNTGFGEPSAMSLDRGDLYVLDPKVNAVWIYRNMEVSQQPHLFFGDQVPPMQDVIDLAVYNEDLFLLHADGHITKCTYSGMAESPTRCDDPYPFSDDRPGRIHGPVIADTVFNQLYFSTFPERSIFMLDPQNRSIYYFSVLLSLQWQYQSSSTLAQGSATAFGVSPNRMAFLAIGNTVYYAVLP